MKDEIYCFIKFMSAKYGINYIVTIWNIACCAIRFIPNEKFNCNYFCLGRNVLFGPDQYILFWTAVDILSRTKWFYERQYFIRLWYRIVCICLSEKLWNNLFRPSFRNYATYKKSPWIAFYLVVVARSGPGPIRTPDGRWTEPKSGPRFECRPGPERKSGSASGILLILSDAFGPVRTRPNASVRAK